MAGSGFNDYGSKMTRYSNEYKTITYQIDEIFRNNSGKPTPLEGKLHQRAAELCSEVANFNNGQPNEYQTWIRRMREHEDRIREIAFAINPAKASAVQSKAQGAPAAGAPISENAANDGNPSDIYKEVPQEMIKHWGDKEEKIKKPDAHGNRGLDKVSGMATTKEKLKECMEVANSGELDRELGFSIVQSFLLYGPPGCGKTYITEAFADELLGSDWHYLFLSGADIHSSLVGVAEKIVQVAFLEAQRLAPCIIFIDEFEEVCRNRKENLPAHVTATTTSFLTAYNDLLKSEKPVIFIAATNYPGRMDDAMLDRFEIIPITLPDNEAREKCFERTFDKFNCEEGLFKLMADETDNYNYRDSDRLENKIKHAIKKDVLSKNGNNDHEAAEAIRNKTYVLTKELVLDVLKDNKPSPKEDIIRMLEEWEQHVEGYLAGGGDE